MLVTIFEKLPRSDLERLQLVNEQFRDVILTVNKLGEEHGPLRRLREVIIGCDPWDDHSLLVQKFGTLIVCQDGTTRVQCLSFCMTGSALLDGRGIHRQEDTHILCPDYSTLVQRLNFCTTQRLV